MNKRKGVVKTKNIYIKSENRNLLSWLVGSESGVHFDTGLYKS